MNADGLYLVSYYALLLNLKLCCCGYYKRRMLTPVLSLVRARFVSSDQFSPVFKDKDSKIRSKTKPMQLHPVVSKNPLCATFLI